MAGSVDNATRSRMLCRSSWLSRTSVHGIARAPAQRARSPTSSSRYGCTTVAQLPEEFGWKCVELVFGQHAADDYLVMTAHDVHHDRSAELRHIVRADDDIIVVWKKVVEPRLVFDDIVDAPKVL